MKTISFSSDKQQADLFASKLHASNWHFTVVDLQRFVNRSCRFESEEILLGIADRILTSSHNQMIIFCSYS